MLITKVILQNRCMKILSYIPVNMTHCIIDAILFCNVFKYCGSHSN